MDHLGFKIWVLISFTVMGALVFVYFLFLNRATPLWGEYRDSTQNLEEVQLDHHAEILEDYFLYDRLGESLHYKLKHEIRQSHDDDGPAVQKAFHKALNYVFQGKVRAPEAMIILAQGGLFEKFNKSFLRELYKLDVNTGVINWDLRFIPEQHLNLSYKKHLENDQVFEWRPKLSWGSKLQQKTQSLSNKLSELSIPGNGRPFQYLAGAIHYQVDLDKLAAQAPEVGKIIFRKYYRVDEGRPFRQYFESSGFRLEHIRLKSETKSPLITVDLIENFHKKNLAPQFKEINLNFSGVIEKIAAEKSNANKKNRLTLVGELLTADYDQVLFTMDITNLNFNIENGLISTLDEKKTKFSIKVLPEELNLKKSSLFKHQIKNKILREHQKDLLRSIKAELFSTRLMRGVKL